MTMYVAVDIGCIECREESAVLGIFTSKDDAEAACEDAAKVDTRNGQHHFEVFPISALDSTDQSMTRYAYAVIVEAKTRTRADQAINNRLGSDRWREAVVSADTERGIELAGANEVKVTQEAGA